MKKIYIYFGLGASKKGLLQTENSLNDLLKDTYTIEFISSKQLIKDDWEKEAALLILPGGADIPYTRSLNGKGNKKIRDYVEAGGSFLGICAGAYFSGSFVEFDKGTVREIVGPRELKFFEGIVQGPVLAKYDHRTESGARSARLILDLKLKSDLETVVYFNGGGCFLNTELYSNVSVLARYDHDSTSCAIVECSVGKGRAILSGVHIEYDPKKMDHDDPYLRTLIPYLIQGNEGRLNLFSILLDRLYLKL